MGNEHFKTISIIGLGYIGLPTAAVFASAGVQVIGVDVDRAVVDLINSGEIHIIEPGLREIVSKVVESGSLKASVTPENADAFLIAVPTPFKGELREPDMSYIEEACVSIAPFLKSGDLVILESTSPVGTTYKISELLGDLRSDLTFPHALGDESDIRVAYCPERVLPGKVLEELVSNDRIIGGVSQRCSEYATALYKLFVKGDCVTASGPGVAEMAKLTENSFRDVNIAFANELSLICSDLQLNIWELITLANRHPRVNIMQPGPGVGGHCIAVDPWFIVSSAPNASKLISTARGVNDHKPAWVIDEIKALVDQFFEANDKVVGKPRLALFGVTFKQDIDDLRQSPALEIAMRVWRMEKRCDVIVVDPNINNLSHDMPKMATLEEALDAELAVLLVAHSEFLTVKPATDYVIDVVGAWSS